MTRLTRLSTLLQRCREVFDNMPPKNTRKRLAAPAADDRSHSDDEPAPAPAPRAKRRAPPQIDPDKQAQKTGPPPSQPPYTKTASNARVRRLRGTHVVDLVPGIDKQMPGAMVEDQVDRGQRSAPFEPADLYRPGYFPLAAAMPMNVSQV